MGGLSSIPTSPRSRGNLIIDSYHQHYFSGNQCRIYFDGIYVADANYIEYSIASNKAPIYSYNDPYYKLVARGNYLVQGNINTNFTERNKLIKVKDELMNRKPVPRSTQVDITGLRTDESISKFFTVATDVDKEAVFRKFEDAYWGTPANAGPVRYLRPDEWDLVDGDVDPDGFDIIMIFGVPFGPESQYSVKQINNVHFSGESMVINTNGNPLVEQYSFFARKIDGEKTIYYPHEDRLGPEEELRVDRDLTNYPVSVRATSYMDGADEWVAWFHFHTNDESIRIAHVHPGDIIYTLANQPSTYAYRATTSEYINPDNTSETDFYVLGLPWPNAGYAELRNVQLKLFNRSDVLDGVVTKVYETNSIRTFHADGLIKISRPTGTDDSTLPPISTNP